jgi:hypothetical protein
VNTSGGIISVPSSNWNSNNIASRIPALSGTWNALGMNANSTPNRNSTTKASRWLKTSTSHKSNAASSYSLTSTSTHMAAGERHQYVFKFTRIIEFNESL